MHARANPLVKLGIEVGPLLVFFLVNGNFGIFWATGAFMATMPVALLANYLLERRVPILPLVSGAVVIVIGRLTLILQDELFIKLKPTIVNCLFAAILFGGMLFGKSFLKSVLGSMFPMQEQGWRVLTFRWAVFFLVLAALNEYVWRNYSTDDWVTFKVFAIMPLTVVFSLAQLPLMNRYRLDADPAA